MSSTKKIGYMGIPFSNSEEMAKIFSDRSGLNDAELVPLISAENVIRELMEGRIDYGVLAVENRFAGIVIETDEALAHTDGIIEVDTLWCHIHHCVFKREKGERVDRLVSHIQALQQSERNLRRLYPGASFEECEDTAYAAEMLSKGMLPEGSAAVCRRDAGEYYGLYLDNENVEDSNENMTKFSFVRFGR